MSEHPSARRAAAAGPNAATLRAAASQRRDSSCPGGHPPGPSASRSQRAVVLRASGTTSREGGQDMTVGWPAPEPGAAPMAKMIMAQAGLEARTLVRNGEQLLLTLIIPVLLLTAFSLDDLVKVGSGP